MHIIQHKCKKWTVHIKVFTDFRENYLYAVQDNMQPLMILKSRLWRTNGGLTSDQKLAWKISN